MYSIGSERFFNFHLLARFHSFFVDKFIFSDKNETIAVSVALIRDNIEIDLLRDVAK